MITTTLIMYGTPALALVLIIGYIFTLRRIVPTNMVHIVQRGKNTVSYGVGKGSNVYYEFPKWLPVIGVEVRILPVSNFGIDLKNYSAYDKDRVPFIVDVKAFFHISDTNKAAEKVESFTELEGQLTNVVQGAVRSILAKAKLDEIMEERPVFGERFTENVNPDLKNWGVETIKSIELMDIRDAEGSAVIHQIMAKRTSAIDMESRTEIAKNRKLAQQAELEAQQFIDVTKAETEKIAGEAQAKSHQAIGIAQAEAEKKKGIAKQEALSDISKAERAAAEQQMEVIKVKQVKAAEINKETAIVSANQDKETEIIKADLEKQKVEIAAKADKFKVETQAEANLSAQNKNAEGATVVGKAEAAVILAKGTSDAESKKLMEMAVVSAQIALSEKIASSKEYQQYLLEIKKAEVSQIVGVAQYESIAEALAGADLKLLVNSGDVQSGIGKLSDVFTSKGASQINGLLEGLKQTNEGQALADFIKNLIGGKAKSAE